MDRLAFYGAKEVEGRGGASLPSKSWRSLCPDFQRLWKQSCCGKTSVFLFYFPLLEINKVGSITHCYITVRPSDPFPVPFNAVLSSNETVGLLGKNNTNESDSQAYLFFKSCNSGLQTYVGTLVYMCLDNISHSWILMSLKKACFLILLLAFI